MPRSDPHNQAKHVTVSAMTVGEVGTQHSPIPPTGPSPVTNTPSVTSLYRFRPKSPHVRTNTVHWVPSSLTQTLATGPWNIDPIAAEHLVRFTPASDNTPMTGIFLPDPRPWSASHDQPESGSILTTQITSNSKSL